MPPFVLDPEPASLLYLINLTAGLLDGDGHLIQVRAREGSRALVTGQSATRVHPAVKSFATQQWELTVDDDATLVALPGPTIPFSGCRYFQRVRIDLAPSARLIWGDIWYPGRYQRGALSERFQFERIVQDLEARRDGVLVYRDRFRWDGPWSRDEVDWYFGGALASASLYASPSSVDLPVAETGMGFRRVTFVLDSGDVCMRWVGEPSAITADLVRQAMAIAGKWMGMDRPLFLESSNLAPNHWFSVKA
jgi:urease accessory protein